MPDLITHFGTAYFTERITGRPSLRILFYAGVLLPDLLTRPIYILIPDLYWPLMPLHTPVGLVVTCLLFATFFEESIRKKAFAALFSGALLHLGVDQLQGNLIGGYELLYPFTWDYYSLKLFGPDDSLYIVPPLILVMAITEGVIRHRRRSRKGTP